MPDDEYHPELQLSGYNLNLNSYGDARGKGLAVYFKPNMFDIEKSTKLQTVQITKLTSTHLDIIVVYRSKTDTAARGIIPTLLSPNKSAMVLGDFNVCYKQQGNHSLVQMFQNLGFEQFVEEPTHIDGGLIDQVYYRQGAACAWCSAYTNGPQTFAENLELHSLEHSHIVTWLHHLIVT